MRRAQARLKKTLNPRTARSAHLTREIKTEAFATELPPTNRNTAARNREKRTGWVSFSGGSESDGNERYAVKEVDASRRLALDFATVVHVPFPPSPFLLYPNGQDKREAGERQVGF
ncbi:hypothetical protein BHM03_00031786 [Ensete ventricosum]|nr:hypothetical protein BHM03_00031786 [Ensete ventricosum]